MITRAVVLSALALLLTGLSLLLVAPKKSGTVDIVCHFFYRETTVARGDDERIKSESKEVSVSIPINQDGGIEVLQIIEPKKAAFGSFRIEVAHQPDSLIIRVFDKKRERLITSTLFQVDSSLRNQFVGDHGFSGLTYVYHPDNDSELQFWCTKKAFHPEK